MLTLEYTLVAVAPVLSFLIAFFLTRWGIPFLKKKRMGQTILEIGPNWHKEKEGTPTMGGIFFLVATVVAYLVLGLPILLTKTTFDPTSLVVLAFLIGHGAIGFVDDYVKFIKHRNKGLSALQKLVFQFAVTAAFEYGMVLCGHTNTVLELPFVHVSWDLGIFYYLFSLVFIVLVVNAVNLTDGLDGLAASNMSVVAIFFSVLALLELIGSGTGSDKLVIYLAVFGGLIAFLCFNHYPAKIFMGDTGSLFLGAVLSAAAYWLDKPLILLLCGVVFLFEALSVVLQVGFFKLTHGKRLFKMAPFHHHLEKCGLTEVKIVLVFLVVTAIGCGVAFWF